jgi:hypothetical protein
MQRRCQYNNTVLNDSFIRLIAFDPHPSHSLIWSSIVPSPPHIAPYVIMHMWCTQHMHIFTIEWHLFTINILFTKNNDECWWTIAVRLDVDLSI